MEERITAALRRFKLEQKELDFIKDNAGSKSYSEIARIIGRSVSTVAKNAKALGVAKGKKAVFDADGVKFLRENLGKMPLEEMAAALGVSPRQVYSKLYALGIGKKGKPWTSGELAYLSAAVGEKSHKEIAEALGRDPLDVSAKCRSLGLEPMLKRWSPAENAIIRSYFPTDSKEEIMARLPGRTYAAIKNQACILKVKPARSGNRDYTYPEVEALCRIYLKYGPDYKKCIAEARKAGIAGHSDSSVRWVIRAFSAMDKGVGIGGPTHYMQDVFERITGRRVATCLKRPKGD